MMIFSSIALCFFSALSFCMDEPVLLQELIMIIGAPHDGVRDVLAKTCRLYHQRFSINSPDLVALINHPLFHTNKKNIQWLAFNAAWSADFKLLASTMRHMEQSDYVYQYALADNADEHGWHAKLCFEDIIQQKMPNEYNDILKIARSYGCELGYYDNWREWDDLVMACYNKDDQRVRLLLPHYISDCLDPILFVAIDKNSDKCINELSLYNKDVTASFSSWLRYLSCITTAMQNDKDKAFEALVRNDIFGCLNYKDLCNKTMLDLFIRNVEQAKQPDGKKYIDIYRKYGGKTSDELDSWGYWPSCITQ